MTATPTKPMHMDGKSIAQAIDAAVAAGGGGTGLIAGNVAVLAAVDTPIPGNAPSGCAIIRPSS